MGFTQHTSAPLFSIRYSAFMGSLFLQTDESRSAIAAYKAEIGEEIVKKGFQGPGSESTKAIASLRTKGVLFGRMSGRLTGVRLIQRTVKETGHQAPYLSVTLTDDDGKYNLSVPADARATQLLIRKLANAKPELFTELNMFATYGQREGADRAYADHGSSLKQGDQPVEVAGVNPKDVLTPQIEAAMSALTGAGVELTDKETRGKRRSKIALQYHIDMLLEIEKRFSAYYEERDLPQETGAAQSTSESGSAAPALNSTYGGFDDMDDDIPM